MSAKSKKNPLSIRLTESAVFLRSDGTGSRRRNESRSSMLRGLLTLDLTKPTRITSIKLELLAKTVTAWPEGIGARRIEVTEEHRLFHASAVYFDAEKVQTRRNASLGPGGACFNDEAGFDDWEDHQHTSHVNAGQDIVAQDTEAPVRPGHRRHFSHGNRRFSADSSFFQRSAPYHEESTVPPTPPYSPFVTHPSSPSSERPSLAFESSTSHAAQTLEDFRNSLNAGLLNRRSRSTGLSSAASAAPSVRSHRPNLSLSRRPSIEDVPENEPGPSTPRQRSGLSSNPTSRPPTPPGSGEHRGRKSARFSLSSVSSVLMDVVRSNSPRTHNLGVSRERLGEEEKSDLRRGRTKEKGKYIPSPGTSIVRNRGSKERSAFSKFGDILKLDQDEPETGEGWKEFKKGTYTYPISFAIPANAPPTLQSSYGSVTWHLRATVHRPGTFKSKFAASREVIIVTCPTEEDTEDTENIIVERHWDQQLQYLISVSGRSFYIGGSIPISFTLMPLTKMKIHRLSVFIEERVDYYTQMRRIARTDPLTRIELLSLKETGKTNRPILPLESDDADAFQRSPLCVLLNPDDDLSEVASSLMGPGPWSFHQDLRLPTSCGLMRITNKNRRSNVVITHVLKCVLRVERGDDLHMDSRTGKRKLFDIVVQTPVQILSCRCNPELTSLPRYSEYFDGNSTVVPKCPCEARRHTNNTARSVPEIRPSNLGRDTSRHSSDSNISTAETSPVIPTIMPLLRQHDSPYSRSDQYERLISGQESEIGEAPPTYTASIGVV